MDRNIPPQSSLPDSLIPHLYVAPHRPRDSSTRTTLNYEDEDFQVFPFRHPRWREQEEQIGPGDPGPSSLVYRRDSSEPIDPHFIPRRDDWQSAPTYAPRQQHAFQQLPLPPFEPTPSASYLYDRHEQFNRRDPYGYPGMSSLSISAPTSDRMRSPESPDSSIYYPRPESRSADVASNDDEASQTGRKRRAASIDTEENKRKAKNARKTAVACNFCRGRKLRCNGAKPTCYNCMVRKLDCEYVSIQRRRGPGKAPKGSRSKKNTSATRMDPSGSQSLSADQPPDMLREYELDALAPELRPYTSVLSLDSFGFQPPQYRPAIADPRENHYSRARTPRSRETSSEDRSDAEELYRKKG